IVSNPSNYSEVLREFAENGGQTTLAYRQWSASEAFITIAFYDLAIAEYFAEFTHGDRPFLPDDLFVHAKEKQQLRYGENPHQRATFYTELNITRPCIATAEQLHGKDLSYNNILDLDSALNLAREFARPACVVVKHNNACGA